MTEFKQLLQTQKSLCRQHQGLDLIRQPWAAGGGPRGEEGHVTF